MRFNNKNFLDFTSSIPRSWRADENTRYEDLKPYNPNLDIVVYTNQEFHLLNYRSDFNAPDKEWLHRVADNENTFQSPKGWVYIKRRFIIFQCVICKVEVRRFRKGFDFFYASTEGAHPQCLICPICRAIIRQMNKDVFPNQETPESPLGKIDYQKWPAFIKEHIWPVYGKVNINYENEFSDSPIFRGPEEPKIIIPAPSEAPNGNEGNGDSKNSNDPNKTGYFEMMMQNLAQSGEVARFQEALKHVEKGNPEKPKEVSPKGFKEAVEKAQTKEIFLEKMHEELQKTQAAPTPQAPPPVSTNENKENGKSRECEYCKGPNTRLMSVFCSTTCKNKYHYENKKDKI